MRVEKEVEALRIAGVIEESIVDGPGMRFVIFLQGCPHRCKGCHNLQTHNAEGGYDCSHEKIMQAIGGNPLISGVTFSGGEPFLQAESLSSLADKIIKLQKDIIVYSGYTYEELMEKNEEDPFVMKLLSKCVWLIDGPYMEGEKSYEARFRGSSNQRIIDLAQTQKQGKIVVVE